MDKSTLAKLLQRARQIPRVTTNPTTLRTLGLLKEDVKEKVIDSQ